MVTVIGWQLWWKWCLLWGWWGGGGVCDGGDNDDDDGGSGWGDGGDDDEDGNGGDGDGACGGDGVEDLIHWPPGMLWSDCWAVFQTHTKEHVLVMELCSEGSVYDMINKPEYYFGFPESELLVFLQDFGKQS